MNCLLHVAIMLIIIIEVFIILFLLVRIGNILAIFKINQQTLLSIECQGIFSSWPNWSVQEGKGHCKITPKSTWLSKEMKKSPIVKFEINLFCFLLNPLANTHCRTWTSIINFWIDCWIPMSARQRSSYYLAVLLWLKMTLFSKKAPDKIEKH